jgi:hypothetical protein
MGVKITRDEDENKDDDLIAKIYYSTWSESRTKARGKVLLANMEKDLNDATTFYFTPDLNDI